jgi:hypothetical protein
LLAAVVGPTASALIVREFGRHIERMASELESYGPGGAAVAAAELRYGLAQMRESARLRESALSGDRGVSGTAAVSETAGVAGSDRLLGTASWWSVDEVAARFSCSASWVRRRCESGDLVATRLGSRGRPWRIDPLSAKEYFEARRTA